MSSRFDGVRRASTMPVRFAQVDAEEEDPPRLSRTGTIVEGSRRLPPSSPAIPRPRPVTTDRLDFEAIPVQRHHQRHRRRRSLSKDRSTDNSHSSRSSSASGSTSGEEIIIHRSRSRARARSYGRDYSSSTSNDTDTEDKSYNFSLADRSTSVFSQENTLAASPSTNTAGGDNVSQAEGIRPAEVVYNILKSRYIGSGAIGGQHQADLTVVEGSKTLKSSLSRWLHFRDLDMHFDNFRNAVMSIGGMSDAEYAALSRLLGRVKQKFNVSKQNAKSQGTRATQPNYEQEDVQSTSGLEQKHGNSQSITWLCVPYFSLDRYNPNPGTDKGGQPLRTLLHGHSSSVFKERDMQQAVCQMSEGKADFCYHVSQAWYLVVGDSMIISCARISMKQLQDDLISVTSGPVPSSSSTESPRVLIQYGVSVLWSFSLKDCQKWFSLSSRVVELWPTHKLLYANNSVTPEMWPRLVNRANHTNENIRLVLHESGGNTSRLKGILLSRGDYLSTDKDDNVAAGDSDMEEDDPQNRALSKNQRSDTRGLEPRTSSFYLENFFALVWLRARASGDVDHQQIHKDLRAIDTYLTKHTNLDDSLVYKACPSSSWIDVYDALRKEADALTTGPQNPGSKAERKRRRIHGSKVETFNSMVTMFEFFLPLSVAGPTVDKFWGALGSLLESIGKEDTQKHGSSERSRRKRHHTSHFNERDLDDFCNVVSKTSMLMGPYKENLSHATIEDRTRLGIPDEIVNSWLHIVMFIVYASKHDDSWREQLSFAIKLWVAGVKKIKSSITKTNLLESSVVMPQEIATLVNFGLLHDVSNVDKHPQKSITQTYRDYISRLQADVIANPLDREHQDKISLLKQEIAIILETLLLQQALFMKSEKSNERKQSRRHSEFRSHLYRDTHADDSYDRYYNDDRERSRTYRSHAHVGIDVDYYPPPMPRTNAAVASEAILSDDAGLSPIDPGGYRNLLTQECLAFLGTKIASFVEMEEIARDLEAWNIRRIETNKDRQDAAIYTFTVVTIIFLPLSTVAGILGMNTSDVRDMEQRQWVFWVVAVPLLVIVITLCLIWTGELDNFWTGFKYLFRKQMKRKASATSAYRGISAPNYPVVVSLPQPPPYEAVHQQLYESDDDQRRAYRARDSRTRSRRRDSMYASRREVLGY